ncbi:hypothetical protein GGR21_001467 [Dysgonomonas hofstadii]|uniref:ATP-grasp domain-containing protein n=1 Tax=Dysgonomonas hofstadii TaxID=637886 RepID=A0A840CPS0_9BACT|nr:hypothetical protein [Dysgonomonas hofstadii]MBB4035574.1 hypothetical protein [Dysgonomonas hofstadii]
MILYFNPGHETAVHNASPFYMPPANVAAMQKELSFLPAWYGLSDDFVLADIYYKSVYDLFPDLPKTIQKNDMGEYGSMEVSLWGISPQAIHYFEELEKEYQIDLNIPKWRDEYRYLNSRESAREVLHTLTKEIGGISENIIPRFYTRLEDIVNLVDISHDKFLVKAPYSSSGRGLLWLPPTGLTRTEKQILHGMLKKQGSVSIEKVLDKQVDFAMEFLCDGTGRIEFAGYSLFYTNSKGAYISNYVGAQQNIIRQLTDTISLPLLEQAKAALLELLQDKCAGQYKGCVGVDMMIYKDENGYKLHPCVEINMRYNMGYLTLRLFENYIDPSSEGRFYIDFSAKEGYIYKTHLDMQKENPAKFFNGKLKSGYLSLCPVEEHSRYRAYVLIE